MQHLKIRVAWHDNRWKGTICKDPLGNPYCITLKNIHEKGRDQQEQAELLADRWAVLEGSKEGSARWA